ncbi:MAG: glycosyltransferase family 4 protein [Candidatus Sumerlaeaceae bacterium]|nr:glycosyltransferase family 4 protein [Candidatus Sumerlaeaceae bacterium]
MALRVCIFVRHMYPVIAGWREGFGGAEIEMYNACVALARQQGVEVTVLALGEEGRREAPFSHRGMRVVPVPYERINASGRGRLGRVWMRLRYGLRLMRHLMAVPADVYLTKLASYEMPFIWLAAWLRRRPLVYRFASDLELSRESLTERIFAGQAFWAGMFIGTLRRCAARLAQTEVQRQMILRNYGLDSFVIGNAHEMPERVEPPDARDTVLWVGRCHPWKRADLFLDLAARLPHRRFVMIAPALKDHAALFEQISQRAATLKNLEFSSGVAPQEMPAYYNRARVMVMTSEVEGFPNVLIEALKTGTPTVSLHLNPDHVLADAAQVGEIAAPGFFFPSYTDELAGLVERLFEDDGLWRRCSQCAREIAMERFSAERVAAQYVPILRRVAAAQ